MCFFFVIKVIQCNLGRNKRAGEWKRSTNIVHAYNISRKINPRRQKKNQNKTLFAFYQNDTLDIK